MRVESIMLAAALAFACQKQPLPAPAMTSEPRPAAAAPAQVDVIRGKIVEKIDASQYTYLRLKTAEGEAWTAVPKTAKSVGETAGIVAPMWMENFKSDTLGRSWERIAFGTLEGEAPAEAAPPARPAAGPGAGMFAAAAAAMPVAHPATAPVDPVPLAVAKASGPQGRTIADIYARKVQLKDKTVSVRGKVVKATNGVLGKNWLHLRDGTGKGGSDDLAVASNDTASVGETVVISGLVHLDRDLGSGYHYDVLVEDARVKKE